MVGDFESQPGQQAAGADLREFNAADRVIGSVEPQRIGRFRFFLDGQRWEWSDAIAVMHGYQPGTVVPTTELLLQHKHPDDRQQVAAALDRVLLGEPFGSRHRIIDTAGATHWVIVAGDVMRDDAGIVIGTSGFYIDVTEGHQPDAGAGVSDIAASRDQIEQAKGILMAVYDIPANRAFELLAWRSQETNIKLRDLATRFTAALTGKVSAELRSQVDHALLTLD